MYWRNTLKVTVNDIEEYLIDVKTAVNADRYRIELNEKRQDNRDLFAEYVISEKKQKEILLSLTAKDFSKIVPNEHKGYEHEMLYVFGKSIKLLRRFSSGEKPVSLYIKFNKTESQYVIVISFHEQKYPLHYPFK
jgi:hypothetical protein